MDAESLMLHQQLRRALLLCAPRDKISLWEAVLWIVVRAY